MSDRSAPPGKPAPRQQGLPYVSELLPTLVGELQSAGAIGLLLADASPMGEIERNFGVQPFLDCIANLESLICERVTKELGNDVESIAARAGETKICIFFPRKPDDAFFLTQKLPALAEALGALLPRTTSRIAYPYLNSVSEIPVGHAVGLYRSFLRQETQIGRLVDAALDAASLNRRCRKRERAKNLQRVLLREEIKSVYEPIVELDTLKTIGFEGLSRGPKDTILENPVSLFAVAEECDLAFEVDRLCRRLAIGRSPDLEDGQRLFLNVRISSLLDRELDASRIGELGWSPRSMVLEISEREVIANYPIFRLAVDDLAKLGFGIALDDVGAGYNSLKAAFELQPDFLKLDMSLVRGIDDDPHKWELVDGLRRFAGAMNTRIIAEGIETEAEFSVLQDLGIDAGQGFLFSRLDELRQAQDDKS